MSLRVLLADESSTIKKVIQLSLQDFAVDVKAVTIGLDVLSVTKTFRPDVVLADVLLAKRSGYEICHDLKNDPETSHIPVVLMWSGFMEIDEQKARLCGADRRLEKPFDASTLRQIVQDLIDRTKSNPVSSFLQFPNLPPFEEPSEKPATATMPTQRATSVATPPGIPSGPPPAEDDDVALIIDDSDESESADEWIQQPIHPKTPPASTASTPASNLAPEGDEFSEFPLTQQPLHQPPQKPPQRASQQAPTKSAGSSSSSMPENILREEIQKWVAQHMPDIAERLIREEINRLLQESEQTIQSP